MSKARGGAEAEHSLPVAVGELLANKYRIDGVLGRGGMGVVVAATDRELERKVAIKFVERNNEQSAARFLHEARAAAKLDSEHITRVFEVGRLEQGSPFIVMEQLSGEDLGDLIARGPLEVSRAAGYVMQICEALAQAHAARIVHRDLKPDNLFLHTKSDGQRIIKVLDFGISKTLEGPVLTESQTIVGSPQYLAPEQIQSPESVDARTDIWALGVVLHELVSGERPFRGGTMAELCMNILSCEPAPLRRSAEPLPAGFEGVVRRCMCKSMDARFASVAELAQALAPFADAGSVTLLSAIRRALGRGEALQGEAPAAAHAFGVVNTVRSLRSPGQRQKRVLIGVVGLLVLGLVTAWLAAPRAPLAATGPSSAQAPAPEAASPTAAPAAESRVGVEPAAASLASASALGSAPGATPAREAEPAAPPLAPAAARAAQKSRAERSLAREKALPRAVASASASSASAASAATEPRCRALEVIEKGRALDPAAGRVTYEWARRACTRDAHAPGTPYRLSDSGISVKCVCD